MAIEKTVFTNSGGVNLANEIAAWLTANASDFFDEIEVYTNDEPIVYCGIDGGMAIKINVNVRDKAAVRIKSGSLRTINSTSYEWRYGVKTSKGIAVYNTDGFCIMATKSNEGTVSVALNEGTKYSCADYDNSTKFVTFNFPTVVDNTFVKSGMTVLAPVVNAKASTYADGLYLQVFSQYPGVEGIITINGKQYYTDGVLALEE
jgi:hypothetical protein